MTEQERLSKAYEDIKVRYWALKQVSGNAEDIAEAYEILKDKHDIQGKKNIQLSNTNQKLAAHNKVLEDKIKVLQKTVEGINDEQIMVVQKDKVPVGQYVTLKRYNKSKKMAEEYAQKYGELYRAHQKLVEETKLKNQYATN